VTGKPCFEDVVTLPEVSEIFGCHLRIWERSDRVIVLAGHLQDLHIRKTASRSALTKSRGCTFGTPGRLISIYTTRTTIIKGCRIFGSHSTSTKNVAVARQ
jgi:hypothetical protein